MEQTDLFDLGVTFDHGKNLLINRPMVREKDLIKMSLKMEMMRVMKMLVPRLMMR